MGYQKDGNILEEELGILLHSSIVLALFRKQILDGKWDESVVTLQEIDQAEVEGNMLKDASFFIFQQNFFEHLVKGNIHEAMKTLRLETGMILRANFSPMANFKGYTKKVGEFLY